MKRAYFQITAIVTHLVALEQRRRELAVRRKQKAAVRAAADSQPALLTIGRFAEKLGISVTTVRRMVREGEILAVKVRARRLVPKGEIERIVAGK